MSSPLYTASGEETCVPIVKNTFISLQRDGAHRSRRMSIPASLRLFLEPLTEEGAECQKDKPRGYSDASTAFGGEDVATTAIAMVSDDTVGSPVILYDHLDDHVIFSRTPSKDSASSTEPPAQSNMQARPWDSSLRYKHDCARVIKRAMKLLQESDLITDVHRSESSQVCSVVLQMSVSGCLQKERVLALAQKSLLDAAVPSKSIYVVGYCSPNAFTACESGFEATFVAMENATTACWHFFKRGFCRHAPACAKRHPVWSMPIRVFFEGEPRAAPKAIGMNEIKVES